MTEPTAQYVAGPVVFLDGHDRQSLISDLPSTLLNVPTGHDDATKEPNGQYAPVVQFWHADCSDVGLNEPAAQGTAPIVLPSTQYVPAEQIKGVALPPAHE
jgi:hypothetical protein